MSLTVLLLPSRTSRRQALTATRPRCAWKICMTSPANATPLSCAPSISRDRPSLRCWMMCCCCQSEWRLRCGSVLVLRRYTWLCDSNASNARHCSVLHPSAEVVHLCAVGAALAYLMLEKVNSCMPFFSPSFDFYLRCASSIFIKRLSICRCFPTYCSEDFETINRSCFFFFVECEPYSVIVVRSIQQPRSSIVARLDNVQLLSKLQCVYEKRSPMCYFEWLRCFCWVTITCQSAGI